MNFHSMESEKIFTESLDKPLKLVNRIGQADIVAGIPFTDETDTIGQVCEMVVKGLSVYYPDRQCVIVAVGSHTGEDARQVIHGVDLPQNIQMITFLMRNEHVSGIVWKLRAIMEVAYRLGGELALLNPCLSVDGSKQTDDGFSPEWVKSLILPIEEEGMSLVIPRFNRNYAGASASTMLVCPLIASIFNTSITDLPGGIFGISSSLLRMYRDDLDIWSSKIDDFEADSILITTAIVNGVKICEVNIGRCNRCACLDEEMDWKRQARAIFEQVTVARDYWYHKSDLVYPLPKFGEVIKYQPEEVTPDPALLLERYRRGFNEFQGLYEEILPRASSVQLRKLAWSSLEDFHFSSKLWVEIVYEFILTYCLEQKFAEDNILNAFIPMCYGRAASYIKDIFTFRDKIKAVIPEDAERMTTLKVNQEMELQTGEFVSLKADFRERWHKKERALEPLLPRVTYREFIPGFPILAPKELVSSKDKEVNTDNIYNGILHDYHEAFGNFLRDGLGLPLDAASGDIIDRLHGLMVGVEEKIGKLLLQGDITTLEGTASVVEALFQNFPHSDIYAINPDVAAWILERHPPRNLLIRHGAASIVELGERYDPNDILALASLSEDPEHTAQVWDWIMGNTRPEHFALMELKYIVERHVDFPLLTQTREPSYLDKLAGRIIIADLPKGAGGEMPKLRYSLTIAKNIVESEYIGEIWRQFAQERKEFGTRVVNSLKGHWGVDALSAHNIFENKIQRRLIERLRSMIKELRRDGDSSVVDLTLQLNYLADCYHLTYSHPDGTFIPCSAWTWASYSYKGGEGVPSALSLHVERDWASRDFLVGILETLGISEAYMDRQITELIGRGMESESLARLMLPGWETVEEVKPDKLPLVGVPEAKELNRFAGNPILTPMPEHAWESKYLFNPGAIRLGDKVYILYRACSDDEISRIGLAISSDGLHIEERLENPVFGPESVWEKRGCEDPRLVLFDGSIYMLYTAYDSVVAQIALASIDVEDFLNRRWDRWLRHGLVFPGFENKDATLFPEMFNGRYFMYHRIEPSIWVTSAEHLATPWPSEEHRILLGPGVGTAWDGFKVGGGSQPIKTRYGWLLIYHGVDRSWIYRLGVLLVALDDPRWILYRSPNPILEPEEKCELGAEGCYVPNVVFTCGAVPGSDKEMLEDDDEILVYYGASDSVACVATAKIKDLIPHEIRQGKSYTGHQMYNDNLDSRR